ncbi:hypothetical protein TSH100_13835 [Azospirillum sp. TSH100]|uniref:hypothetical protein n=1 Tax=Azospirillum sp. TSH100 TaxID=652764 RepID=UPI000D60E2ED|nr:hypothetical protein [Azospirillum sp. TSH100]PWC86051.1 hypothetical protein TSH100_13835 [Azospirillum sp. TSH100]QCG89374.1 hypothetical protein E6C72_16420 [Azospirillum sp. TSH100]
MNIPAHRAAAVEPTPAHSFELRDGELVNLTEEDAKAADAVPASSVATVTKGRRPASEAPIVTAPMAE